MGRFLLDHDVPDEVARVLSQEGYIVTKLRDALPTTTLDEDVLDYAFENRLILISCNRDDFLTLAKTHIRIPA